ncbi:Secreted protein [Phytophthora cinnamomi]|uniref:Secreted protein n=1 Tax=Phytophthora cinnamomi TaxID=4785 RepID=UPI0035598BEF|nr:Secreted protein [Phytophthora cinnamomi]
MVRGQTVNDYRPTKSLVPAVLNEVCRGYEHLEELQNIVHGGVEVRLSKTPPRQVQRPPNHGSARDRLNVLRKNIRKEQDAGRCLVLDRDLLKQWPEIIISPFGVVDKGGEDTNVTGRTIHDLSYPEGTSINDCTDQDSIVKPEYTHCDAVATEILKSKRAHPNARVCVMAGDVASAFRNISIHSNSVYLFAGHIEEDDVIVIELAAPFGWTGSPGFYEIAGGAVAYVHGSHTTDTFPDGFFNYHWVDDHINVAADIGTSCDDANRSLRYAMVAVLGADAINAKKFTDWNTRQRVLGLVFDSMALTYQFTDSERELIAAFKDGAPNGFDINFRELLSCAFAVHAWGRRWGCGVPRNGRPCHVLFRIDNTSAVAWQNKLASRNPRAQVIIRLLSWWETSFQLRFSASHVAGTDNERADAGSRIAANPSYAAKFSSLTPGWSQVSPTVDIHGLTDIWLRISERTPLPTPHSINTGER